MAHRISISKKKYIDNKIIYINYIHWITLTPFLTSFLTC